MLPGSKSVHTDRSLDLKIDLVELAHRALHLHSQSGRKDARLRPEDLENGSAAGVQTKAKYALAKLSDHHHLLFWIMRELGEGHSGDSGRNTSSAAG
jgi:hypothetical protein